MAIGEYFAASYSEARAKLLAAARIASSSVVNYALPKFHGPRGQELILDVARLGPQNQKVCLY
jgi:hypothetical protein